MSVSDNTKFNELNELLQQLKDLHAPDRCEGFLNDAWHGMQRITNYPIGGKTDQQKITDYWNSKDLITKKSALKKLASKSLHFFYYVCREVDERRTVNFFLKHKNIWELTNGETPEELAIKQSDIDIFIDRMDVAQVQQEADIAAQVQQEADIAAQVQKMFDIMIVQWAWRDRMLQAWDLH